MLNTVDVLAIVLNPFLVISEGSSALIFFLYKFIPSVSQAVNGDESLS